MNMAVTLKLILHSVFQLHSKLASNMATTNPKHINEIYPNHAIVLEASDLSPLILPTFLGI